MKHLSELELSMYVDGEITGADLTRLENHLESCEACRERAAAYRLERQVIARVLTEQEVQVPDMAMPKFRRRIGLREFAIANLVTGLIVWLAQFVWKTLAGELLISAFSLLAFPIPDVYAIAVDTVFLYFTEGNNMIDAYLVSLAVLVLISTLTWLAFFYKRAGARLAVCAVAIGLMGVGHSSTVQALEIKRSEGIITIAEGERIDDTVVAAGETVVVDGDVTGDLLAFSRRIVVNGSVGGNLIAFGESISVEGSVGGTLVSAGERLEVEDSTIAGDLWFAGEKLTFDGDSRVSRNTVFAGESAIVEGDVGKDIIAAAESIEVSGNVSRDIQTYTERLSLLSDARVGGDVTFRSDEDNFQQAPEATVEGEVIFKAMPEEFEPRNRYLSGEYYLWQLLRLASAFLAGVVLLWLVPVMRDVSLEGGVAGLKTAGIGLVALVSTPIIMALLAVTLVGLPLAAIGAVTWLLTIYAAKIVVASMIGQLVLANSDYEDNLLLTLLVGLVIVIVAVNIPAIGGVISFIFLIVGIGLIVQTIVDEASYANGNE